MRLTKPKSDILRVFNDLKVREDKEVRNHLLQLEEVIGIIWAYRMNDKGCYLSRETLASMCYTSVGTIKRLTKWLRQSGLVKWNRWSQDGKQHVGYKPSELLESYLVKGPAGPLQRAPRALDNPPKGGNRDNTLGGGVSSPHQGEKKIECNTVSPEETDWYWSSIA